MRQAQSDFFELYGKRITPYTRKQYFYFIVDDDKKYVHKQSLRFIYSNRDTFVYDEGLNYCRLTKEFEPIDIVHLLQTESIPFMPQLVDVNEHFLVYEYVDGKLVTNITHSDFVALKHIHNTGPLTPFYNSVNDNFARNRDGRLVLIDFKQLDPVDSTQPFYVYLRFPCYTELHVDGGTQTDQIKQFLSDEFSVHNLTIVNH